ncbi:MAG: response regulator [Herbaspirillum sp.]
MVNNQKKLKVFLIEDAPQVRAVLTDVLSQSGKVDIVGYADGERDAVRQLRSMDWDVAVVDIALKQGTGLDVLAKLQRDDRQYGKRVVFAGESNKILRDRTIALGADKFYDKARDIDALVDDILDSTPGTDG